MDNQLGKELSASERTMLSPSASKYDIYWVYASPSIAKERVDVLKIGASGTAVILTSKLMPVVRFPSERKIEKELTPLKFPSGVNVNKPELLFILKEELLSG